MQTEQRIVFVTALALITLILLSLHVRVTDLEKASDVHLHLLQQTARILAERADQ